MNVKNVDYRDPFARQEAVALWKIWLGKDVVTADRLMEEYACRLGCVAVECRTKAGAFMGFGMAAPLVDGDPWCDIARSALSLSRTVPRPWVVMELHVAQSFRRFGAASAILRRLEYMGVSYGDAVLGVDVRNERAIALYRKAGWRDTMEQIQPKGFTAPQHLYLKTLNL